MAALDLLGRRGCLRILWELREGESLTFRGLATRAALSPATLNTRLAELREARLVEVEDGYRLAPLGRALVDALAPLQTWSGSWQRELARARPRRPAPKGESDASRKKRRASAGTSQ